MGEKSSDPNLKYGSGIHWIGAMLLCWACLGYRFCVAKQDFGLQIAKSPPCPFGSSCWPMRPLIAFHSPCRVYQQSLSPRQFSFMLLADDLLMVYTELKKRSQLCHSLSMKKSSVVFFLWSLKGISDLELLENQQSSPWFNFQRRWLNSQKAVIMLAVIKRAVPKKNKNSPPTNFYCLVTWEQKTLQRQGRNSLSLLPPQIQPDLSWWDRSMTASYQLYFSANVLTKRNHVFSLNKLNLPLHPADSSVLILQC